MASGRKLRKKKEFGVGEGKWTAPAPECTAIQPEVADYLELGTEQSPLA